MIRFNCKHGEFRALSNEYGNVWFEFCGSRFLDASVVDLFRRLQNCDGEEFLDALKWLQPGKDWTARKEQFWFHETTPIRGVVAKMLGSMKDRTPTARARRQLIAKRMGLKVISITEQPSPEREARLMLIALRRKFRNKAYRDVLLQTGDAVLHQTPVVGAPDKWTWRNGKGGDLIGKLLIQLRNELR